MRQNKELPALNPQLPVVDLHRHLEGSLRIQTVIDLSRQHNLPLPAVDPVTLERLARIAEPTADILELLPKFDLLRSVLVDYEACQRVTWECLEDAALQGLDYLELRFSPLFMAEPHHLDPMAVASAVCEAWQEAQSRLSIMSRLIVILSRTYGPESCQIELEAALAHTGHGVVGIDLAGDEARWPAHLFREHFSRAREAGLHATVHAGEFAGAESVVQAVEILRAERIGHAVHAADDPAVLDLLADQNVAIEVCPTSNMLTCSVPDFASHPLPLFLECGLCVTLNTDDPAFMGNLRLEEEYHIARDEIGLTQAQLEQIQRNGLKAAFLTDAEKATLSAKIDQRSLT